MNLSGIIKRVPILLNHTKDMPILNRMLATQHICRCTTLPAAKIKWRHFVHKIRVYSMKSGDDKLFISPKITLSKDDSGLEDKMNGKITDPDVSTWKRFLDAADPYMKISRVDKPIGVWLLFWPCSWSISLAAIQHAAPPEVVLKNTALFLTGAFVMRSAGCTINDLWDKDIDARVERTKNRPLVSGALSNRQAIGLLAAQLSVGLTILLQLNWYSVALGTSSMVLVLAYPLAKRVTDYPQLVLGATFNWGALLGYSATAGSIDYAVCLPLYAAALCWTVVYDTIYAQQDKADDARIGIKSTALTFGSSTKPILACLSAAMVGGSVVSGCVAGLEWGYYAALGAVGAHLARQIYTLQENNAEDCASKFKSNSLVGGLILLGILTGGYRQYFSKIRGEGSADTNELTHTNVETH